MDGINERLLAELEAKDDLLFKLGDTFDVKASILLIVITFAGTQTAYFFNRHLAVFPHFVQYLSVFFLVLATVAAIVELWPRTYHMVAPEVNSASRIEELKAHYADYPECSPEIVSELIRNEIEWANFRIAANKKMNATKSLWLNLAFYPAVAAVALNILTLLCITIPF